MSELVTRIPAEEMTTCKAWSIPEVQSKNTVSAIKKESSFFRRNREKSRENKKAKNSKINNKQAQGSVEIIEDVVLDSASGDLISAEELKNITENAEKLGREEGYGKGYEKGYEEGYQIGLKKAEEEGLKQGLDKAEEKIKAQVKEQSSQLNAIAETLLNPLEKEQKQLEKQLLDLVCQLTKATVKRELMMDSSLVLSVVQDALSCLNNKEKNVTLYLNSQDVSIVKEILAESELSISYEVDDSILAGGCRVDNQLTAIDATIEKQLESLLVSFVDKQYPPQEIPSPSSDEPSNELSSEEQEKIQPEQTQLEKAQLEKPQSEKPRSEKKQSIEAQEEALSEKESLKDDAITTPSSAAPTEESESSD